MGRRRQSGDKFSQGDLAVAAGVSRREVQHVADMGLLPDGSDIRALKRIAVIGGLVAAGTPLLAAGALAKILAEMEFNRTDGELPSGLDYLARELPKKSPSPTGANDFWYHRAVLPYPKIYTPGAPLPSDVLIEVVERKLLFIGNLRGLPILNIATGGADKASFAGWIENWERGSQARVVHVTERIGLMDDEENPTWRKTAAAITRQVQMARRNAVGWFAVNASLAIRNGLDRVAENREEATVA